jgi:hypothetical protein
MKKMKNEELFKCLEYYRTVLRKISGKFVLSKEFAIRITAKLCKMLCILCRFSIGTPAKFGLFHFTTGINFFHQYTNILAIQKLNTRHIIWLI